MKRETRMVRGSLGLPRMLLALTLAAVACTSPGASPSTLTNPPTSPPQSQAESQVAARQPVIVDYSPTVSDVGALLYLLSHPGVEVLAITLPVTGEASCELGLEVTLGILALFERDDIPVACDPELPDDAEEWPVEFLAGLESLRSGLPAVVGANADARPAHELIADVAAASDQPVTLYAVAPLTNVARALDRHLDVVGRLDRIVIMGGAVDAPGNVGVDAPAPGNVGVTDAEWNFRIDVPAAARVLASGAQITLVPLDATDHVPVPGFWQRDLEGAEQTEPIKYLSSLVEIFPAVTSGFFYLWDELAASVAAGEGLVTTEELNLIVVQEAGPSYGSTVRDPSGALVLVATAVPDPSSFYAHFLTTLAGAPVDTRTSLVVDEESAPRTVVATSTPEEVLAFWLVKGLRGEAEAAASAIAPGAPWVGLGDSPDVFVEGSEPFDVFDIEMACTSDEALALCDLTWNDLWISANPDLERGGMRVQAEVVNGMIVAFREFVVSGDIVAAFSSHVAWLEAEQPTQPCAADIASKECSELLVATVGDWVASR